VRRGLLVVSVLALALAAAPAGAAEPVLVVKGRGWGHGVGLSQWGARGFAERGWGHRRILAHYYPGTRLGPARVRDVRVLLGAGLRSVRVGSKRPFRIVDDRGRRLVLRGRTLRLGPRLRVRVGKKWVRLRPPVRFEPGAAPVALDGSGYRGALVVRSRGGRMSVVNEVTLERYLRGVVPWEMPDHWHREALRAQAVVARSYALATLKPGQIYDLLSDARSQVYGGIRAEDRSTNLAVGATAGQVLWWNGVVATTFYHSTSGGRTAAVQDVWPGARAVPYLVSRPDPYEGASPHHRWPTLVLRPGRLRQLRGARDVVVERNGSGRARSVVVRGRRGVRRIEADAIRRALGLRSSWFQVGVLALEKPGAAAVYGRPVELRGIARGVRGAVVQRLEEGRWRQVARARVRADGRFVARVRARGGARYRVAAEEVAAPPVAVPLAPRLEARVAETGVLGLVRPAFGGRTVAIQRRDAGAWRTVARAWADATGRFRAELALEAGDYRAYVTPLSGLAAAASRPFRVAAG
jgi:stage II sporulation protein D